MKLDAREPFRTGREARVLWAGIIVPPLAWLADMQVSYMLTPWVCRNGQTWTLHAVTVLALAVVAVCARRVVRAWKELGPEPEEPREVAVERTAVTTDRSHFMAKLALGQMIFIALVILAGAIPKWVLHPCD